MLRPRAGRRGDVTRARRVAIAVAVTAGLTASALLAIRFLSAPPNVIVLTVDTLRPDRLSFSGHPRDTSPQIDQLAQDSVLFENAVTTEPLTQPSAGQHQTPQHPSRRCRCSGHAAALQHSP